MSPVRAAAPDATVHRPMATAATTITKGATALDVLSEQPPIVNQVSSAGGAYDAIATAARPIHSRQADRPASQRQQRQRRPVLPFRSFDPWSSWPPLLRLAAEDIDGKSSRSIFLVAHELTALLPSQPRIKSDCGWRCGNGGRTRPELSHLSVRRNRAPP